MNRGKIIKFAKQSLTNENSPKASCFYDVHQKKAFSENVYTKANGNFVCQLMDEGGHVFYTIEIDKNSDTHKGLIK